MNRLRASTSDLATYVLDQQLKRLGQRCLHVLNTTLCLLLGGWGGMRNSVGSSIAC